MLFDTLLSVQCEDEVQQLAILTDFELGSLLHEPASDGFRFLENSPAQLAATAI